MVSFPLFFFFFFSKLSMAGVDDVEREVEFQPMKGIPCDPRHMIAGHDEGLDGSWTSGFFDKGKQSRALAARHAAIEHPWLRL